MAYNHFIQPDILTKACSCILEEIFSIESKVN